MQEKKKRVLLLVGAGASLEFGAPSTTKLTHTLADNIAVNDWLVSTGAHDAFKEIRTALATYYQGGEAAVNFEQIFHCAHELQFAFSPSAGAVNAYRPALFPFLTRSITADEHALRALNLGMIDMIYNEISKACAAPQKPLAPLSRFLERLRSDHVTRVYTTNYDDFFLQAAPDLFTGFEATPSAGPARFQSSAFWDAVAADCIYHLHGSIHCGFSHTAKTPRWAELFWYHDREEALSNASYSGSGDRRMDGSTVDPTAIITGLDKLSRLQRPPFSYYYAALAEDVIRADLILVDLPPERSLILM